MGIDPFPSVADVAYLSGYPLLALGLGMAIRSRVRGGDHAGILDAAILATGSSQPVLYVEFRKDGIPIDPGPWWAATEVEKVRG